LTFIVPQTAVFDCKDPDDNYLLSLCIDSQSDYLVTGDKQDLISLNPYKGIKIVRLQELLDIIINKGI
jgi:predicted nucleic acid-binding protein